MRQQRGFTLIEILIAMSISALLVAMVAVSLNQLIRSQNSLQRQANFHQQLNFAKLIISRDISEAISLPLEREQFSWQLIGSTGFFELKKFSSKLIPPIATRSLQTVSYRWHKDQLLRLSSHDYNTTKIRQPLLSGINAIEFHYLYNNQRLSDIDTLSRQNKSNSTVAIEILLQFRQHGEIRWLFPLPIGSKQ